MSLMIKEDKNSMNIINRIKAFFSHNNSPVELDLHAAEIREGRAYLHPKEGNVTYLVKSDDISIFLNHGVSLTNEDIIKFEKGHEKPEEAQKEKTPKEKTPKEKVSAPETKETSAHPVQSHEFDQYKKRILTMTLYESEYEAIMLNAKQYGFKRADYILACINSAPQKKMQKEHEKIVKNHNKLRDMQKQDKVKAANLH